MSHKQTERYIGLMSGTSLDGIDAALVRFEKKQVILEATHSSTYPKDLHQRLNALIVSPDSVSLDELGQIDALVAEAFSNTVKQLLNTSKFAKEEILAIGSHGQTIRHRTDTSPAFTMQIGDPSLISARTGITTIADFRRKDLAVGGQGAPLVPAFHEAVFFSEHYDRIVVNIGGISNMTLLQKNGRVTGHDCGPGNTLMDQWAQTHIQMPFDHSGAWAKMGRVESTLLLQLMTDAYFKQAPPKSTGREHFNLLWLYDCLSNFSELDPVDTQATLCELTAQCIARDINSAIQSHDLDLDKIYICGGGALNVFLLERLQRLIPCTVASTQELNIDPNWVEAMAFAWLARQTSLGLTGNLPNVTGASKKTILGGIYQA